MKLPSRSRLSPSSSAFAGFRFPAEVTPLLADAARPCRRSPGDRWHVDETYVKVGGVWRYVYRAVDQHGLVIDVLCRIVATALLRAGSSHGRADYAEGDSDRGGHRQGTGLPTGPRRTGPSRLAPRRTVRHQPHRGRPRQTQTSAPTIAADALTAAPRSLSPGSNRPERTVAATRIRKRHSGTASSRGGIHRTRGAI